MGLLLLVLAALFGVAWQVAKPRSEAPRAKVGPENQIAGPAARKSPVVAMPVRKGNIDIYLPGLGTVTPLNTVRVHSQVDGQLVSIEFEEGQVVRKGDLLALIDPKPFEVQLSLVKGQLARNQALLEGAQMDLERYRGLLAQDSIARQQVDAQESLVRQYRAAVQASQGEVENAQMQLDRARVTAPISGKVGLRQIGPGSIVRASDPLPLVVITQMNPVSVLFPIPEDALPRVMKRLNAGGQVPVDAYDRALTEKLGSGHLLAADNQIDPATGTIKLRAEFSNPNGTLIANQFVNVKMLVETRRDATLMPSAAIQRGAVGTFVYVVRNDQTVVVTPVKVGPSQGEVSVVEAGVAPGAMVVVEGADNLRDGASVELIARDPATPSRAAAPERGQANHKDETGAKPQTRSPNRGA